MSFFAVWFNVILKLRDRSELDKSYDSFLSSKQNMKSYSRSQVNRPSHLPHSSISSYSNGNGNGLSSSKIPPTGPRALKKPRLSEPPHQVSPPHTAVPLPKANPISSHSQTHSRDRHTGHAR